MFPLFPGVLNQLHQPEVADRLLSEARYWTKVDLQKKNSKPIFEKIAAVVDRSQVLEKVGKLIQETTLLEVENAVGNLLDSSRRRSAIRDLPLLEEKKEVKSPSRISSLNFTVSIFSGFFFEQGERVAQELLIVKYVFPERMKRLFAKTKKIPKAADSMKKLIDLYLEYEYRNRNWEACVNKFFPDKDEHFYRLIQILLQTPTMSQKGSFSIPETEDLLMQEYPFDNAMNFQAFLEASKYIEQTCHFMFGKLKKKELRTLRLLRTGGLLARALGWDSLKGGKLVALHKKLSHSNLQGLAKKLGFSIAPRSVEWNIDRDLEIFLSQEIFQKEEQARLLLDKIREKIHLIEDPFGRRIGHCLLAEEQCANRENQPLLPLLHQLFSKNGMHKMFWGSSDDAHNLTLAKMGLAVYSLKKC